MHWTEISEREVGEVTVLDVRGYMTLSDSESLLFQRVTRLREEERRHLVLNLRQLSYIDSVGIGEIVRAFLHLTQRGGMLTVCDVSPRTREVLETTHLDTVIRMFESEEDAVEAARPPR